MMAGTAAVPGAVMAAMAQEPAMAAMAQEPAMAKMASMLGCR
ncbi:hypothetical protein [Gordoniibacillus kamchatkensis]|nr:hypothetical protein [Paenibacillus sp. VKM B-2647]